MDLEYKRVPFEIKEMVAVDGGGWEIAGYASSWTTTPDSYGDVVARGAFAESIAARPTKFLFEHREPIGKQLEIREDELGLYGRWSVVDTRAGTDAYKLAKAGVLDSLSIGYMTDEFEMLEDGTRVLKKISLFEVSAVALPAQPAAVITHVKARRARRVLRRKQGGWDDDEPLSTFAEGSYEQLAEDLEEAFEAVAIPAGTRGYAEVVATFSDRFVAVVTLLDPNGMLDPIAAEDPVYWQVPYVVTDGVITLGAGVAVEPETTFGPVDAGQQAAAATSLLSHRLTHIRGRLARHGITLEATS